MAVETIAVSVGDNCMDHYLPPVDRWFVGGNALNVAVHLQKAGIHSAYVGEVGDDENGILIRNTLIQEGVDVSRLKVSHGKTSFTEIRLTSQGDRQFVHEHVGPNQGLKLDRQTIDIITQHRLVHNSWLGGTDKYLAQFRRADILISMDYGERYTEEFLAYTIPNVDIAFFSLPEEKAPRAKDLAYRAISGGAKLAIVTLGREGSLAYDSKFYHQPVHAVQVVDTLGAGDTFIGVFLARWLHDQPVQQCMEAASQAASHTCTHFGAWDVL